MKIFEKNGSLSVLDLSANSLRDKFATSLIMALRKNFKVQKIDLTNTRVTLKHLDTIKRILASNRARSQKSLLPYYKYQVEKLRVRPRDFEKTERKVSELEKAYKKEKHIVKIKAAKLEKVQTMEQAISSGVIYEKKQVDDELRSLVQEIECVDSEKKREERKEKQEIALRERKLMEVGRVEERLQEESIVLAAIF